MATIPINKDRDDVDFDVDFNVSVSLSEYHWGVKMSYDLGSIRII